MSALQAAQRQAGGALSAVEVRAAEQQQDPLPRNPHAETRKGGENGSKSLHRFHCFPASHRGAPIWFLHTLHGVRKCLNTLYIAPESFLYALYSVKKCLIDSLSVLFRGFCSSAREARSRRRRSTPRAWPSWRTSTKAFAGAAACRRARSRSVISMRRST